MNKYYDAHKEEYKKSALEYYEQHKEERKKKMGEYYEKNKETILKKARVRNAQYTPKSKTYKTKEGLMKLIYSVAKKNNLLLSYSPERIINAKLRICKDDLKRCPCDNKPDSLRWCGSEKCVKECKENGKCHCGLFYYDKRGEKK